jgi:hypothetical protein
MSRLKALPGNNLQQRLLTLQTELTALKEAQVAGSQSVVLTRTVTGNNPDFTVSAAYHTIQVWKVTFTPTDPVAPGAGFKWQIFFDESIAPLNTALSIEETPTEPLSGYLYAMGTTSGTTDNIGIVIVVYAVGTGSISIARIS